LHWQIEEDALPKQPTCSVCFNMSQPNVVTQFSQNKDAAVFARLYLESATSAF